MLTPELISVDELESSVVLIRKSLGEFSELVAGQQRKQQRVKSIAESIDRLEQSGRELIVARQRFAGIDEKQAQLKIEIRQVFQRYEESVSLDIGRTIEARDLDRLNRVYLPELRMIKSLHQQYLLLFLEIREVQNDTGAEIGADIANLKKRIKQSNAILEIYQRNEANRGESPPVSWRFIEKCSTWSINLPSPRNRLNSHCPEPSNPG